jgi:hypothetical protein
VLTGFRHDAIVGVLAFETQEAKHGVERRQPEFAVAQAWRRQPVLVKVESRGRDVGYPFVETCDKKATDAGINHDAVWPVLIT